MPTGAVLCIVFRNSVPGQHPGLANHRASWLDPWRQVGLGCGVPCCFPPLGLQPATSPYSSIVRGVSCNCLLPGEAVLHNVWELGPKWGKSACPQKPSLALGETQGLGMFWFHVLNFSDLWEDILDSQIFIYSKTPSLCTRLFWVCQSFKNGLCGPLFSWGVMRQHKVKLSASRWRLLWWMAACGGKGHVSFQREENWRLSVASWLGLWIFENFLFLC